MDEWTSIIVPGVWVWVWAILHVLGFVFVAIHCLRYRRQATSAILWMFLAWSFPVIGPFLFLSFGINRVQVKGWEKEEANQRLLKERRARESHPKMLACWCRAHETFASKPETQSLRDLNTTMDRLLPNSPLLSGNGVEILVTGDEAYGPMLHAIAQAANHIHLQTFILGNDTVGREFLNLLSEKARSGVVVRLLYDGFGSNYARMSGLLSRYRGVPGMQIAGWSQVNPLKRQFQLNLRNHRKLLVVDGREAFTGGINLHEENVSRPGHPAIRDYHFALKGPIVQELQYSFLKDWYFMTGERPDVLLCEEHFREVPAQGTSMVRIVNAGPTAEVEALTDILCAALGAARKEILAVTPYFVPTQDILRAFRLAALRGVDVRLVVPKKNNHRFVGLAAHALYDDLLTDGVRIYHRPPPFLHAKALVVDDDLAIVGSANIDARSLRLNYETNLAVYDEAFVRMLKKTVLEDVSTSEEIVLSNWRTRSKLVQTAENFCSLLSPVL